ncbi:hypothetical protein [Salegentibacter sp. UBA1130]|uniref:hypothetical protein n=1 Tax=Salegentibacter sp. UBA1130 TaxID=1947451 RepID=UPI00257F2406|nr:hypothetical protein [Salegentibacter sp. UBA1130]
MKKNKVPKDVKIHRLEMAEDLLTLSKLLEKYYINTGQIRNAASQLKDETKVSKVKQSDEIDYSFYGYKIDPIEFSFTSTPEHTHPEGLDGMTLSFDINLIASYQKDYSHSDPLKHLEFNIIVIGYKDDKDHIISYHLDRHPEGEKEPLSSHPKYHFQFGGRKLNKGKRHFGQSIILDSPRLMHYPMDIILGVDFVLSNFFPEIWSELKKNGEYISLVKEYRNRLLKPYFCSLANHWRGELNGASTWNTHEICPQLYT